MKILLLSNVFPPGFIGGYELGALDVVNSLASRGHDVTVLTSDYFLDDEREIENADIIRVLDCPPLGHDLGREELIHESAFFVWKNIRHIASVIRRKSPDLVICFNIGGLGPFGIVSLLKALKIPTIYYYMDNFFGSVDLGHERLARFREVFGETDLGDYAANIYMSANVMGQVRPYLKAPKHADHVVPGWIPDEVFDLPRQERADEHECFKFVFSSRVAPHKGTEVILDALKILAEEKLPKFHLDVYGSGQTSAFLQRAVTMGVDDRITYRGMLDKSEMVMRFGEYDALLFPTWPREPFGFVACEAAAAGCIPVMTRGIGASEWFLDGVDAFKIARSPESLAQVMRKLILMPTGERAAMKATCVTSMKRQLKMSTWMERVEAICLAHAQFCGGHAHSDNYGVQSSLLALYQLWKER